MEWKIVNKKLGMSDVEVYVEANSPVIKYFFAEIQPKNLPKLLSHVVSSTMYLEELASIRFFHELDWEDIDYLGSIGGIMDGEVNIYHEVYGDVVIKDIVFYQILLEYASKLYQVFKSTGKFNENWDDEMIKGIHNLETLLKGIEKN